MKPWNLGQARGAQKGAAWSGEGAGNTASRVQPGSARQACSPQPPHRSLSVFSPAKQRAMSCGGRGGRRRPGRRARRFRLRAGNQRTRLPSLRRRRLARRTCVSTLAGLVTLIPSASTSAATSLLPVNACTSDAGRGAEVSAACPARPRPTPPSPVQPRPRRAHCAQPCSALPPHHAACMVQDLKAALARLVDAARHREVRPQGGPPVRALSSVPLWGQQGQVAAASA